MGPTEEGKYGEEWVGFGEEIQRSRKMKIPRPNL